MDTVRTPPLKDGFGRDVSYLRMSVTDRCNYRCTYCMAPEGKFVPRASLLTLEELLQVASAFVQLGGQRIRLTGGEPLIRNDLPWLIERISALPGLVEVTLTTNGARLEPIAHTLRGAGLKRINISLDTLDPQTFRKLTRVGELGDVLAGIRAAKEAGFQRLRINAVMMRGINDHEIIRLVNFAANEEVDIAFIEEMPFNGTDCDIRRARLVTSDEILQLVGEYFDLVPSGIDHGGPARFYEVVGSASRMGLISAHSQNFCGSCNRIRLTAEGRLLLCLGNDLSVDLRAVLREHPGDTARLREAVKAALPLKPEQHYFDDPTRMQPLRFMHMTGG